MSPIQQMLLGAGGAVVPKTYVDDIFSSYLWIGNNTTGRAINNGIDLSTEGGMAWVKKRDSAEDNVLLDTERGANNFVMANRNNGANTSGGPITAFNSNGFTIDNNGYVNGNNGEYASWTFRKAPGFFDVVTYSGDGNDNRSISHSLGCSVGMMIIKVLNVSDDWLVWHNDLEDEKALTLNTGNEAFGFTSSIPSDPTSSSFTVSSNVKANALGKTYVCYLFAKGEEGYNSVKFDGAGDYLSVASSSDFAFGTGDFTIEAWCYRTGGMFTLFDHLMGNGNFTIFSYNAGPIQVYSQGFASSGVNPGDNTWFHLAVVRESGTLSFYIDGVKASTTHTLNLDITTAGITIGTTAWSEYSNGYVSNLRVVKGTAVYTSNFTPSTTPLTNITNTVLLCCNKSTVTGSTVIPSGTITVNGNPTVSSENNFSAAASSVFGDSNQSVIRCGSYVGNGSSTGPEINLGWEPQWVMVKNADSSSRDWVIWDSMRGIVSGGDDPRLKPNATEAEGANNAIDLTPTGFKLVNTAPNWNENNKTIIFLAIRRPDGYCGKPPELGTGVFAMDTGNGSSTVPCFDSGFPVDFLLQREFASQDSWITGSRLTGNTYMYANATDAEAGGGGHGWDSNVGGGTSRGSSYQAWMWKRHAGFDVVTYTGLGASSAPRSFAHSLGRTPEMIWTKGRDSNYSWRVWHKDLGNGGASAAPYYLVLNDTDAQTANGDVFGGSGNALPTSTHWTTGGNAAINESGTDQITMLFASVNKISKVGSYTGSASSQTITLGFQPRLLIVKKYTGSPSTNWYVIDTLRGWGSGDDKYMELSSNAAQADHDFGAPTSTGMTLPGGEEAFNASGSSYIYYAHA